MKWFHEFCDNNESFFKIPKRNAEMSNTPPFFQINPDAKQKFIQHAKNNLRSLSGELVHEYMHDTLIPELIQQQQEETGEIITKENF